MNRLRASLLALLVVTSLSLNLVGIDFAQPAFVDQSVDAIHPALSIDAVDNAFGQRSTVGIKYPRLHFLVTGAVELLALRVWYGPGSGERAREGMARLIDRGLYSTPAPADPLRAQIGTMIVAGRCVSALMGTLLVLGLFAFARALFGFRAALISAALTATAYPFVFYAHTLNVDVPCMFWGIYSLYFAARAIRYGNTSDIVWAMVLTALAGATKDQVYSWYVLGAPVALFLLCRPGSLGDQDRRPFPWRGVATGSAVSVPVYLLVCGLPFDSAGFVRHFEFIFGPGVEPFRRYDASLSGLWGLLNKTGNQLVDGLGWPLVLTSIAGGVIVARRDRRRAAVVAAPAVSVVLSFIIPVGYSYLRFTMPIMLMAVVLAGVAVSKASEHRRLRWLSIVFGGALLISGAVKSINLDRLLLNDPREVAIDDLVARGCESLHLGALLDGPHSLPLDRCRRVSVISTPPDLEALRSDPPALLVVTSYDNTEVGRRDATTDEQTIRLAGFDPYLLQVTFAPRMQHPVRREIVFQPTIRIYERSIRRPGE